MLLKRVEEIVRASFPSMNVWSSSFPFSLGMPFEVPAGAAIDQPGMLIILFAILLFSLLRQFKRLEGHFSLMG